jgi:hypothetical protein
MRNSHRIRASAVAALAVFGVGVSPLPAQATTLTITGIYCESTTHAVICEAFVSGGTPAYTYTWGPGNVPPSSSSMNTFYCPPYTTMNVYLTVRDSLGATAYKSTSAYCAGRTE